MPHPCRRQCFDLDRLLVACSHVAGAYHVMKARSASFVCRMFLACSAHILLFSQHGNKSRPVVMGVLSTKRFNKSAEILLCYLRGSMDRSTLTKEERQIFICSFVIDLHPVDSFPNQPLAEIPALRVCASDMVAELFASAVPQIMDPLQRASACQGMFPRFATAHALYAAAFSSYQAAFKVLIREGLPLSAVDVMEAMLRLARQEKLSYGDKRLLESLQRKLARVYAHMHQLRILDEFESSNALLVYQVTRRGLYSTVLLRPDTIDAPQGDGLADPDFPIPPGVSELADEIDIAARMIV